MRAQAVAYVIIRAVSLKLYLQVASGFDTDFLMHILKKKNTQKQTKQNQNTLTDESWSPWQQV